MCPYVVHCSPIKSSFLWFYFNSLQDLDQVHIILNVVGSPTQEDLDSVTSEQVREDYNRDICVCDVTTLL